MPCPLSLSPADKCPAVMHRLFVEPTAGFSSEARHLAADLRANLGLDSLTSLRLVNRYDLDGLDDQQFHRAAQLILSEAQVESFSPELSLSERETAFAVAYLPGQFDQRADSAAQCVQILTGGERPSVHSARVFVIGGDLSASDLQRLKDYVINPVDSHEVSATGPLELPELTEPKSVERLTGFRNLDAAALSTLLGELGLAMSEADLTHTQSYFRDEDRDPTITEIRMLDTYWSDHCRHTTFMSRIAKVDFQPGTQLIEDTYQTYLSTREEVYGPDSDRPVSLMDIALIGMKELRKSGELDNLEVSQEINAASIVVDGDDGQEWLVQFKNETHNHPTEIEPFGGAATCLGGCIRDPLSGRSYVYQAMRVSGAADPRTPYEETLPGKLPQKKICQGAARGYSSYGNQIGLATGKVSEVYHPGYAAKRMEIGAVVAAAPRKNVFRGGPDPGDYILLIGGRTGRDGVGGATGSSKEHTETALENSAEVQKGDAPTERKIQRLFRNPELAPKIKICNDFGAGGISVAIGEIADSLEINLDVVPKKYMGLDGTELAISESQERMAICVDPSEMAYFVSESDKENLECVHVATVTDTGRLRMTWRGETIVDLSRTFLDTNGVEQEASVTVQAFSGLTGPLHFTHEHLDRYLPQSPTPGVSGSSESCPAAAITRVLDSVHRASSEHQLPEPASRADRLERDRQVRLAEERELRRCLGELASDATRFSQIWTSQQEIQGAEQRVTFDSATQTCLKANNGSYHGTWANYLERLKLHNLLFGALPYHLEGILLEEDSIHFLVRQPFAEAREGATRSQVEAEMAHRFGAYRFANEDYYLPQLDLIVEDLHGENVLVAPDGKTLLFVDPVIFRRPADLSIPKPVSLASSGEASTEAFHQALTDLNTASQKGLGEMFDSSVGAGTVLAPFGGRYQRTPVDAMVATLPFLEGHSKVCTHMAWGFDPYLASWSPFHGAIYAVAQSVCRAVASGAKLAEIRLTLQEYFPKLGDDPSRWGLPFAALLGAFKAQHELRLAAIGGKDSMSGTFKDLDVPPTLVSFALSPGQTNHVFSPEFKEANSTITFVEVPRDLDQIPDFQKLIRLADQLHDADGILAVHTLDHGGIATGLAKMAFGNGLGVILDTDLDLFQERHLCFLIESAEPLTFGKAIGRTQLEPSLAGHSLDELLESWTDPLSEVYPETVDPSTTEADTFTASVRSTGNPKSTVAKPKVIIPSFPGTNCEYDTAKVFREAGAEAEIQVFRNLTPQAVEESLTTLAAQIRESQILMLPGGFSAGDEPAGSGKFIATILRNPQIADAVMDLLKNRDGLILGICNGFQALIKTGLVPYGEIRDPQPNQPTLTFNDIGRHVARYGTTRIASTLSPWLAGTETGDLHNLAFSHGEGRFWATDEDVRHLAAKGQIATQYTDLEGHPTMDPTYNKNGSIHAIEGITSPCGRVFGKMGHTERRGPDVGQNIPGNLHQPLFKAGVTYFQ